MQTGLERLLAGKGPHLRGKRVGLITNHTGIDRNLHSTIDLLLRSPLVNLAALFGPEHGVRGEAQAGVDVEDAVDTRTQLPVYSLYGETNTPTDSMLEGLDALVFDIQDVGVRFATYLSTMIYSLQAASRHGLEFVVLDRPNPIGGTRVEGNVVEPAFYSFVGAYSLPVRHGMTVGEIARLVAGEQGLVEPSVARMQGWRREEWFDRSGLPWVLPSPNLPTLDSLTLYPGTCFLEGTTLSEGRGTTRPFEIVGAPWIDPFTLVAEMERRDLPGVAYRPTYFTPTFSKHAGASCGGMQIHITDRAAARPVDLGIHLLHVLRSLDAASFAWRSNDGRYFADLLLGSDEPRLRLDAGEGAEEILAGWEPQTRAFEDQRRPYLLYA